MSGLLALPADIVERARAGDRRALENMLTLCRADITRYARRHCEAEDVEEAVQDALWILYRRLGGLRSAAALAGWLFQIIRRTCLALIRRRRRHLPIEAAPAAALRDGAGSDLELRLAITGIIAGLPQNYREVLVLKDVQGLSADEAAAILSISPEAARSRLHRARALVRAALTEQTAPNREAAPA
jgi:RNA polymerase sigma factor (sigma-70 family)